MIIIDSFRSAMDFMSKRALTSHLVTVHVYFIPLVLTALAIESVRFVGYLTKFGLYTPLLLAVSWILAVVTAYRDDMSPAETAMLETAQLVTRYLTIACFFITGLILVTSINNVPGSSTVILGQSLQARGLISLCLYLFGLIVIELGRSNIKKMPFSFPLVFFVFSLILISQLPSFVSIAMERLTRAYELHGTSEETRIRWLWKEMYPLAEVIREKVDPKEHLLIPPQKYPWPVTGNQFVVRRFVYPQVIISYEDWSKNWSGIDWVLADNGGSYAAQNREAMGWPLQPVPMEKIILAEKWKKIVTINEVRIDNQRHTLEWTVSSENLDGTVSAKTENTGVVAVAEIRSFTGSTSAELISSTFDVSASTILTLKIGESTSLAVVPFVQTTMNDGNINRIYYPPLKSTELVSELVLDDIDQKLFPGGIAEPRQVQLGFDMGYQAPLPYLYGKSIIKIKAISELTSNKCDSSANACQWYVLNLIADNAWEEVRQTLLDTDVQERFSTQPWFGYAQYLLAQHHNQPSATEWLEPIIPYWSSQGEHNLPQFLTGQKEIGNS